MLEVHSPDILLTCAPSTSTVSTLDTTGFLSAFQSYEQTPLPRGMFDDTEGLVLVQMCASPSSNMDLTDSRGSYLAFGAAGALLKHTQEHLGLVLTSNSLRVFSAETPFHTHINAASIDALQLVQSNTLSTTSTQQPFFSGNTNNTSLLKFLDATTTRAGAQLLRSNILQPLRDIPTLQARYDAIDELLEKEDLLSSLHGCLKQLPKNMDSVCGNLVLRPSKSSNNMIQRIAAAIQSFIQLREIITTLGPLRDALQEADSELLCALHSTCSTSEFEELLARLDGLLDDDIHSSSSAFLNRTQQCFALRNGVNPLLDIARQTFCKATEAVHEHADEMRELHDFSALKVQYTARRGFFFSIPLPSLHNTSSNTDAPLASPTPAVAKRRRPFPPPGTARDRRAVRLPSSFTFLQVHHNTVQCTTEALNALNTRLQDSSNDCLCLTEEVLDQTSKEIIEQCLSLLHRLIDGIALLDMLCGFAHKIKSSASPYVRPVLTSMGPIALVDCRHPVLESMPCCASFQPNDTWLALDSSFHIIAGPNMSGKSTYLQQIALAVIMAQIGFYVPASFASVTPVDKIFTRMGTRDDIETSSSSFMEEMEETAYILTHATPRSLVLIDELGRSTSTLDGLSIAWAVSEALIARGVKSVIATHLNELCQLTKIYPQCRSWYFKIETTRRQHGVSGLGQRSIKYSWKLESGDASMLLSGDDGDRHYGLIIAESVQFPLDVIEKARQVAQMVEEKDEHWVVGAEDGVIEYGRAVWDMVGKLSCIAQALMDNIGDDDGEGWEDRIDMSMMEQLVELQEEAIVLKDWKGVVESR